MSKHRSSPKKLRDRLKDLKLRAGDVVTWDTEQRYKDQSKRIRGYIETFGEGPFEVIEARAPSFGALRLAANQVIRIFTSQGTRNFLSSDFKLSSGSPARMKMRTWKGVVMVMYR